MAEYIKKDEVIGKFIEGDGDDKFTEGYNFAVNEYRDTIKNIPAADVQPVKYGRWIWDSNAPHREHGAYKCSNCGCHSDFEENFCYNCGVRIMKDGDTNG